MVNADNRSRLIISLLVASGFFAGLVFGAYLFYAWVPQEMILRDASPRLLRAVDDPKVSTYQYREVYLSALAKRYKDRGATQEALGDVENAIGVTLGDVTRQQSFSMVQAAANAAREENNQEMSKGQDPDRSGWYTVADQNALTELAARLEQIRNDPVTVSGNAGAARNLARIFGLIPLAIALFLVYLAYIYVIRQRFGLTYLSEVLQPAMGDVDLGPTDDGLGFPIRDDRYNEPPPEYADNVAMANAGDVAFDDGNEGDLVNDGYISPDDRASSPIMEETLVTPNPPSTLTRGAPGARTTSIGESLISTLAPTTYQHGIDNYDEGFEIKSASGEFIGECGVSIAERLDPSSPAPVCALAVWVFDKHAFKHVTKMLMTEAAYNDPVIRAKLAQRGDAVLAQARPFQIDTATLNVIVDVSNLKLDEGRRYFENVTLAFNVYKKP